MIAHLVGGGPMDGHALSVRLMAHTICIPYGLTPFGPFYTLQYKMESSDPDGLLVTYRFEGWPDELPVTGFGEMA